VTVLLEQWPTLLEATQPLRRFPPSDSNAYGDAYDEIFADLIIDDAREYIKQHPLDEEYTGIDNILDICETLIKVHDRMMRYYSDFTSGCGGGDVLHEEEEEEDADDANLM